MLKSVATLIGLSACLLAPRVSRAVDASALQKDLPTEILPYFQQGRSGAFAGKGGIRIAYRVFPAPGAPPSGGKALVLINGRSEFMEKYAETIFDLRDDGYSIYTMDHRGQGESGRMLPDSRLGHVVAFRDYVDDFGTFLDQVVRKDHPSEIDVIAHSMGGAIVTIYAIEHPGAFKSMVLSSPMYQANLGSYSETEALILGTILKWLGRGDDVAPGRSPGEWKAPFEGNHDNSSEIRYNVDLQMLLEQPSLAVGGPTVQWVLEAIRAGRWIRAHGASLKTPTLILQAQDDQIVINPAENEVCSASPSCRLVVMDGSMHEVLNERDPIRNRAQGLALEFIGQPDGVSAKAGVPSRGAGAPIDSGLMSGRAPPR